MHGNRGWTSPLARTSARGLRTAGAALTSITLAIGGAVFVSGAAHAEDAADESVPSDAQINSSLDAMAKLFAGAVANEPVRQDVHQAVAQRFDGDTEALWETITDEPSVVSALSASYGANRSMRTSDATAAVDGIADDIPGLQVAVPNKFDEWDPAIEVPLVASMPVGVDDLAIETITAYDATGKAYELDAQEEPARPVIVLGVNERTDESGNLLSDVVDSDGTMVTSDDVAAASGVSTLAAANYEARIVQVHLYDDKEPWAKGAAEVSYAASSTCGDLQKDDVNVTGLDYDYAPRDEDIYLGTTRCDVVVYWWEDDSGSADITLTYAGVGLGVSLADGDDRMGGILIDHSWFEGGSNNRTNWSALYMITD